MLVKIYLGQLISSVFSKGNTGGHVLAWKGWINSPCSLFYPSRFIISNFSSRFPNFSKLLKKGGFFADFVLKEGPPSQWGVPTPFKNHQIYFENTLYIKTNAKSEFQELPIHSLMHWVLRQSLYICFCQVTGWVVHCSNFQRQQCVNSSSLYAQYTHIFQSYIVNMFASFLAVYNKLNSVWHRNFICISSEYRTKVVTFSIPHFGWKI